MIFGRGEKEGLKKRVVELEEEIFQLETNLIHDPLTGLKTRAFFEEEVSTFLEVILQQGESPEAGAPRRKERFGFRNLSVIFFDIDHFKKVNDTYGHNTGDLVLKLVAQTIQASLRTGDTVARWGGEEIVASLLGATEEDAAAKAEEIRKQIEKLKFKGVPKLSVTISAGVAGYIKGLDLHKLVKRADQALYEAKEDGRNRVAMYGSN
jgi:diguanylate cyclase (GGDEF)-like protein